MNFRLSARGVARLGVRRRPPLPFGRLVKALDAAPMNGRVVVDLKKEWKRVFPFEK